MAENKTIIITEEDKEILLQRYLDIEWCDDVTELRCVRCQRVAISHYVSNCQHRFCRNCRKVFSDGGHWKCPQCKQYVTQLNDQDVDIEYKLGQTRVYCPNKKYGCQNVDQLTIIAKHLKDCENIREKALPVEYTGTNTADYLYSHMSDLSAQLRQLSDNMRAMKSENEANWKQVQAQMRELEQKVDNMDQLAEDLDGIKANLNVQTERLNDFKRQLTEGLSNMMTVPMLEEMREEMEKMKVEQTRLALKAKDDSDILHTIKGQADAFIPLLEQKNEKLEKKLNKHTTNMNTMMDVYRNQLEDVKNRMDTDWENPRALQQMENRILEVKNDLQKQCELQAIREQYRNDERRRDMEQTNQIRAELVQKWEKMEAQMHKDGGELRQRIDNQLTTINKDLATTEYRVTANEKKLTIIENKVTTIGGQMAAINNGVTPDDNEMTTINNLVTIEKKVDANDNRIATSDKKVEAIDKRIAEIEGNVTTTSNRLTWMENWQKKLQNISLFCALRQKDGCQVSGISFTVKNIQEEITKARYNERHRIESQPFYTNIMGYRAKILVYPNDRKSNYVGVYLTLVEGEFDDNVPWPFNCKYQFHSISRDGTQFASVTIDPKSDAKINDCFNRPAVNHFGSQVNASRAAGLNTGFYLPSKGPAVLGPAVLGPAVLGPAVLGPAVLGPAVLGPAVLGPAVASTSAGYGTDKYIKIETLLANKAQYLIDGGLKIDATIWLNT